MSCIVWGCNNSDVATADPSVHYYVFPKHPIIAQQWIQASGWPPEQIDLSTAQICSIHFDDDSYTTEIKVIDCVTCYTKVLKYDAVPRLYLPPTTEIVIKEHPLGDELDEIIVFEVPEPEPEIQEEVIVVKSTENPKVYTELQVQTVADTVLEKYKHVKTKEDLISLENSNKIIKEKILKLELNIKRLKGVADNLVHTYKMKDLELQNLHQEYLKKKRSVLTIHQQKMLLSKVFSESQMKILSGKKKIYWSDDDMAVAYTIRHLSNRRCYMYLTKKMNIPLPAMSSIKRWMTSVGKRKKEGEESE